jgi:phosphoribosyl 1,2-cyclic phosphodiesterase
MPPLQRQIFMIKCFKKAKGGRAMATLYPLYSSSKGNCTLLVSGGRGLLIDCGVSRAQIVAALEAAGLAMEQVDGLLLTHEHSDHIKALPMLMKHGCPPVFATAGTLNGAEIAGTDHKSAPFDVGPFHIIPITTCHDCADPCGYRIEVEGKALAIVTDTGRITPAIQQHLCGCSLIMLESNYDPDLLENGSYPAALKRRILSPKGHLSNGDCAAMLALMALEGEMKTAVLAHLSDQNNTPLTAKMAVLNAFDQYGVEDVCLEVGGPWCPPLEV